MNRKSGKILLLFAVLTIALYYFRSGAPESEPRPTEEIESEEPAPVEPPADETPTEGPENTDPPRPPPPISAEEIKMLRQVARSSLSSTYSAQRAFHVQFGRYTTDLKAAGWTPASPEMTYKMGFLMDSRPDNWSELDPSMEDPSRKSTDHFEGDDYTNIERYSYSRDARLLQLADFASYCKFGCTAEQDRFEILLILPLGDDLHLDVWTMNEKKELVQMLDGVTGAPPQ